MIPSPFPLHSSIPAPDANWVMIGITALSAAASIAVAWIAFTSAREARFIADRTEQTRFDSEERREKTDYVIRLNSALADLLQAIAAHLPRIKTWLEHAGEVELHGSNPWGEFEYETEPTQDAVIVRAQVVRMIATGDDSAIARSLSHSLVLVPNLKMYQQEAALLALVHTVREWRSGERDPSEIAKYLEDFQAAHDPR